MPSSTTHSDALLERRAKTFWVSLILGFFALDLFIAIIAIVMAAGDPSFRPMPDYGDRSVAWEVHHQERLRSDELGWSVSESTADPDRQAIDFVVTDRNRDRVSGASGSASVYHLTRVAEQKTAKLEEVEPGRYRAAIDCRRPGYWKIELRLQRPSRSELSTGGPSNDAAPQETFVYEVTTDFSPPTKR